MASHFVGLPKGKDGLREVDFLTGTSSNASAAVKLRIADGVGLSGKDVRIALKAFENFLATPPWVKNASITLKP